MSISEAPISGLPISADGGAQLSLGSIGDPLGLTNNRAVLPPHPNYIICDRTGFKVDRHRGLKKEWTGALVREESWEPRHPQDYVRSLHEHSRGSPRPEQSENFISAPFITRPPEAPVLQGSIVNEAAELFWSRPTYYYPNVIISYSIYRRKGSAGAFQLLTTIDVSNPRQHTDTTLTFDPPPGNFYQYYVVANSFYGTDSPPSNILQLSSQQTGLFVASSDTTGANTLKIMTSSDGITWTMRNAPTDTNAGYSAIAYSPPLNLIVSGKSINSGTNGVHFIRSSDGISWAAGNQTPVGAQMDGDVLWIPEQAKFVSSSGVGSGTIHISTDGITCTSFNVGFGGVEGAPEPMAWSPDLGIGIGLSSPSGRIWTTSNFQTWTDNGLGAPNGTSSSDQVRNLIWVSDLGLFIYLAGNGIYTSPTGLVWTQRQALVGVARGGVVWSNELNRAVCVGAATPNFCYTSEDGINWTSRAIQSQQWTSIARSDIIGLFVAIRVGTTGTNRTSTSPDGITWTAGTTPADGVNWRDILAVDRTGVF